MATLSGEIRNCIETLLDKGQRNIIIYPFGDVGTRVKDILNKMYGIQETYIVDNYLCKYNSKIYSSELFGKIDCTSYGVIVATTKEKVKEELYNMCIQYFPVENIVEIFPHTPSVLQEVIEEEKGEIEKVITKIGKYSYGSLCGNNDMIESIGAFCSFAEGCRVVPNHDYRYITTHPMLYCGHHIEGCERGYDFYKDRVFYFPGVSPIAEKIKKNNRTVIGNDVWLGQNVIITNGAKIRNGVIAGAGAVITKDVPDYAVVVGVPARVIWYRYTPEQIEALNKIAWWDWSDDEIRERYEDFYLPIEEFIKSIVDGYTRRI